MVFLEGRGFWFGGLMMLLLDAEGGRVGCLYWTVLCDDCWYCKVD